MRCVLGIVFAVTAFGCSVSHANVTDDVLRGTAAGGLVGAVVGAAAAGVVSHTLPEKERLVGTAGALAWAFSTTAGVMVGGFLGALQHDDEAAAGMVGAVGGTLGVMAPVGAMAWALGGIGAPLSGWGLIALGSYAAILSIPILALVVGPLGLGVYAGTFVGQALQEQIDEHVEALHNDDDAEVGSIP